MNYTCPKCNNKFENIPREKITCSKCKSLLFLYKNGNLKELKKYIPNSISLNDRLKYLIFSILIITYGTFGLIEDDIELSKKKGFLFIFMAFPHMLFIYRSFL